MNIIDKLHKGFVIFDGGMGTMLQSRGLPPGALPELWCLERPEDVIDIHRAYLAAGCEVLSANSFGANPLKFDMPGGPRLPEVVGAAIDCARTAAAGSAAAVALDIGPLGKLVGVPGGIAFEEAVSLFAEVVRAGRGADFILIETLGDIYELKAAVLAAKENSGLPVVATVVMDGGGRMLSGGDGGAVVALLEGLGVSALGLNCSLGPLQMKEILPSLLEYASIPVVVQPNAGLPALRGGRTIYDIDPSAYAGAMREMAKMGARGLGGCCGTTPEYIAATAAAIRGLEPPAPRDRGLTLISSGTHALRIGDVPLLIGERINPTGKKKIKEALAARNYDEIIAEGVAQAEAGAHILDVNAGLPGIDEAEALRVIVTSLQRVIDLPLQIDTADPAAMERALREYCGIPLINSVSGKEESLAAVLPLVKKYGGVLVALALDDTGIPGDIPGRLAIAERIVKAAEKQGIDPKNIVFDPLAMSVGADPGAPDITLGTLAALHGLGRHTLLGVSNISFGLPAREVINSAFFTMALAGGLSLAIMNPHSAEMMKAYFSFLALTGRDRNFARYIDFTSRLPQAGTTAPPPCAPAKSAPSELRAAINRGMRERAAAEADALLAVSGALEIINEHIIPALNEAGESFEKQKTFLPQLLMSADAASSAFAKLKESAGAPESTSGGASKGGGRSRGPVILATVKGDIHDIGKNIVKLLLESHGYEVVDLGRNVSYETILNSTAEHSARLVGLSALMTTTLPAMEESVRALHERFPDCSVMVGGAVLTEEYARSIGADYYSPDAMGAVRIAEKIFGDV